MSYEIKGNQVQFRKGQKPWSIKSAQRECRNIYLSLVQNKIERSYPVALGAVFMGLGKLKDSVLEANPTYMAVASSAAKAYCAVGDTLSKTTMYSMNVTLSPKDVASFADVPATLSEVLTELGQTQYVFLARES
jgi:hypothetical protein